MSRLDGHMHKKLNGESLESQFLFAIVHMIRRKEVFRSSGQAALTNGYMNLFNDLCVIKVSFKY